VLAEAHLLEPPFFLAGVNFTASTRGTLQAWSWCSLTRRMTPNPPAWLLSIPLSTTPTTIGTYSCQTCNRGNFTGIESTDHSTPSKRHAV